MGTHKSSHGSASTAKNDTHSTQSSGRLMLMGVVFAVRTVEGLRQEPGSWRVRGDVYWDKVNWNLSFEGFGEPWYEEPPETTPRGFIHVITGDITLSPGEAFKISEKIGCLPPNYSKICHELNILKQKTKCK